jgi:MoxR-like ATPase
LPTDLPRVLLIDEIDKSEIDLPNDLLNLFEDGEFSIPELQRLKLGDTAIPIRTTDREKNGTQKEVEVKHGVVRCRAFPLVIMTSNGERDFPSAFLRRCLRFKMPTPKKEFLEDIVRKHLGQTALEKSTDLVTAFCDQVEAGEILATDQLLNAIHWRTQEKTGSQKELTEVAERIINQKPTSEKAEPEPKLISVENHLLKDLNSPDEE